MNTKRVKFTFPENKITEPLIYQIGQRFEIITNIRRADVRDDMGWVILELQGNDNEIDEALKWIVSAGVRIDSITGDVVEG